MPARINYYAEVYSINNPVPFFDSLLTKATCWEYENERRLIIHNQTNNNINHFKKEELEGIIFGLNVNHDDASKIYQIMEKYYINKQIPINFYKAQEHNTDYSLNIIPIQTEKIDDYIESLI